MSQKPKKDVPKLSKLSKQFFIYSAPELNASMVRDCWLDDFVDSALFVGQGSDINELEKLYISDGDFEHLPTVYKVEISFKKIGKFKNKVVLE